MVLTKETWKLANSTGIFGQHSWSGLLGDDFKLPVGRISATKKTPFVPMWPSTFGFLGFYGWNHGDWPHGNPAKKQVAKAAKNLVKHFPFIDVWWYAQWKRCSRYFYELQQQSATFLTNSHFFEVLPVFVACPAPAAAFFFPGGTAGKACGGTITTDYLGSSAITPTVPAMTWHLGFSRFRCGVEQWKKDPVLLFRVG